MPSHGTSPPDSPLVREIRLEGAKRVDAGHVLSHLATRAPGPWPWSKAHPFDPVQWDLDLRRIERVYETEGFYGTRVVDSAVRHGPDGVRLWARIREAPPTRVTGVEIAGTEGLPRALEEEVRAAVQVRAGETFLERAWEATKHDVQLRLNEHGYARAVVTGDVQVSPAAHTAQVALRVAPGRVYRYGVIRIAGNPAGPTPGPALVIARATLPEGETYAPSALKEAQERIYALGAYAAVAVTPGDPDPGSDRLPVLIELRDAPRHTLRLGGGIAADTARQAVRATGEWVDRDFLGRLRTLRLALNGGVAFAPSVWAAVGGGPPDHRWGPLGALSVDLGQPVLGGAAGLSLFASAVAAAAPATAWSEASVGLQSGVLWRVGPRLSVQASYGVERWWIGDTPLGGAGAPPPDFGCAGACALSFAEQRFTFDARDDPGDTRRGYYLRFLGREYVRALGSSFSGVQGDAEARLYVPLAEAPRALLAGRVRLAAVDGTATAPVMLRLFSGGDGMRGFGDRRLAPRLRLSATPDDVVPTGGQALAEASVEVRWTVRPPLEVVGFVDAGSVTLETLDLGRLAGALRVAAGVGVRWQTRVAPIRLDLAVLLPIGPALATYDASGARVPAVDIGGCFGIGGRSGATDGRCALHIWIGETF